MRPCRNIQAAKSMVKIIFAIQNQASDTLGSIAFPIVMFRFRILIYIRIIIVFFLVLFIYCYELLQLSP
jgi:hypothetical protein